MRICLWGLVIIAAYVGGLRVETWLDGMFLGVLAMPCILGDVKELKKKGLY